MIYGLLAPIYDEINADIDYSLWADFIEDAAGRWMTDRPELVLDLCCGTGSMTLELARRGFDMTGVDYSPEMLDVARSRADEEGLSDRMLWLCQDMREFELYGTVDLTVCCLDSINHLTSRKDLMRCLSLVHNYLIPDGLFIFDVNGKEKFERVYGQQTYAMDLEDRFCIWQNDYDADSRLCDFYITLFKESDGGSYDRYDECQTERMYTLRSLKRALTDTGFEFIGAYSNFAFKEATDRDERIYIVAKCLK